MRTACLSAVFALGTIGCGPAAGAPAQPAWGVALEGNPLEAPQLAAVAQESGLKPALVVFFQQWPEQPAPGGFPRSTLDAISAVGATPVITWEPMFYRRSDGAETMIASEAIVRGDYDAYLADFARAAAAWGRPLIIRFAHEMNLRRYHWGGSEAAYGPASPARYIAMWRHVVAVFRRENATNVRWAFSPNCESVPGPGNSPADGWNTARAYYPGHEYVDVLGMDGYNWGDTQTLARQGWNSTWRSFADIFGPLHRELRGLAPDKPIYVFETASAPTGGDKRAWFAAMAATASAWQLEGVVWFEVRKEVDWRLRTGLTPDALAPLRAAFRSTP